MKFQYTEKKVSLPTNVHAGWRIPPAPGYSHRNSCGR